MSEATDALPAPQPQRRRRAWLGPGLMSGASDDDPSGIATYSQAGAGFGYGLLWVMVLCYPMMAATQEISARIGRVTGTGLAGNLRRHYPGWLLQSIVVLVFGANCINLGADLGAMGDVVSLVVGGPRFLYMLLFGMACVIVPALLSYDQYARVVKWSAVFLLAYFATAVTVDVPWGTVVRQTLMPSLRWDSGFAMMIVAVLGTSISPYMFFWQASLEGEDARRSQARAMRAEAAMGDLLRLKLDTYLGIGLAALIALAVIVTTAATLNRQGVTDIQTSAQAAAALRPVAGSLAQALFSAAIVGSGLMAVPMLAGSAAYAVAESRRWPRGLDRRPQQAPAFYSLIIGATAVGMLLNLAPIDPIKALILSSVINGIVAVPVLVMMMLLAGRSDVMGPLTVSRGLALVGWLTTIVMAVTAVATIVSALA